MSRPATLTLCLLLAGCGGDATPNKPSPNSAPTSPGGASAEKTSAPAAKTPTLVAPALKPGEPGGATEANSAGPVPGPIDPAWLRPDLFPGATVSSAGRTPRDNAGLFSTQLLLALPDGTTRDACVDTVSKAIAADLPALERKEGPNDRVTLSGSNDDYAATIVCGEAKGKMSAYLSYRWLRAPKTPEAAKPAP
jgi:hypothetical protein